MISVIIPTFNREKTIERSVRSVLGQTYKNIEVIVVDDCSIDNTENVVNSIDDSRLIYFKLDRNKGANYARNKGVKLSSGDYVAFQDSDDYWLPEKLEKQMNFLNKSGSNIVFCSLTEDGKEGKITKTLSEGRVNLDSLLIKNVISTQTLLGEKRCFQEEKFDSEFPRFQDWEIALRLVSHYNVHYLDEVLVIQYIQDDSITQNPKKAIEAIQLMLKKHNKLYANNKKSLAIMYQNLAAYSILNDSSPYQYYIKALKIKFSCNTLFKLLLSIIGIYQIRIKKLTKQN